MEVAVTFPIASMAEQGDLVSELRDTLRVEGVTSEIQRDSIETQDAGTILSVVLAAPAVIAAVRAIHAYLVRSNQSVADIRLPDGTTIKLRNMESKDIDSAIEVIEQKMQSK